MEKIFTTIVKENNTIIGIGAGYKDIAVARSNIEKQTEYDKIRGHHYEYDIAVVDIMDK